MSPACDQSDSPLDNDNISLINLHNSQSSPCESNYSDDNISSCNYGRSYRNFRSNEEYLWAMKEDLAEWLNNLYEININADNFIQKLETGVVLCRHANNVIAKALSSGHKWDRTINSAIYKGDELRYRANAKPKTFQARDNVSNFIAWCRSLKIHECLLFETDDLVLGKNEKSFILCLLEVSRKCTAYGIIAPLIVQLEQEIDRELLDDQERSSGQSLMANRYNHYGHDEDGDDEESLATLSTSPDSGYMGSLVTPTTTSTTNETNRGKQSKESTGTNKSESQIITNNLQNLHERVVDLLNRCTCPSQFPMVKVADGKYRVGNPKVLIYVRILRNHVMVRVGGGWDTLGHYLDRHDPCRCRVNNKQSPTINNNNATENIKNYINNNNNNNNNNVNAKSSLLTRNSTNGSQIWINYNRPYPSAEPRYTSFDNLRCTSNSMLFNSDLTRRDSIGLTESSCSLNSFSEGSDRQPSRSSQYSDDLPSSSSSSSSSSSTASSSQTKTLSSQAILTSPIGSTIGKLHHLSTGQLHTPIITSSSFHHLNHHHPNHSNLNRNQLINSSKHQLNTINSHQSNSKEKGSTLGNCKQQLNNNQPRFSTINNQSKPKSGIAKLIGTTNHYYSRSITNLNKVNSCTNIRFCHQLTKSPSTSTPTPTSSTIKMSQRKI